MMVKRETLRGTVCENFSIHTFPHFFGLDWKLLKIPMNKPINFKVRARSVLFIHPHHCMPHSQLIFCRIFRSLSPFDSLVVEGGWWKTPVGGCWNGTLINECYVLFPSWLHDIHSFMGSSEARSSDFVLAGRKMWFKTDFSFGASFEALIGFFIN